MLNPILASRDLTLLDDLGGLLREVRILIYMPQCEKVYANDVSNSDWSVQYEVLKLTSPESRFSGKAVQVDQFGALIQALSVVAKYVRSSDEYVSSRLYWLSPGDNCGLPLFLEPDYRESVRGA